MPIVVADNTARIEYTVSQGVTQTVFPIPFAFFNKEDSDNVDVKVFVDGVERTLGSISTTTFSITSGGDGAKGSLSTTVTGASGGSTVIVFRDTKIGRITDFPSGGAFEVSKLNTELDTLVAIEGDFEDHVSRSIRLQDKDTAVSLALPLKADRLGKQLGFHATTGAVEMFTPESLAIASDSGSSSVDLTSNTLTFTGGEGIDTAISSQTLTITGELATTSNKGVASFSSTFFDVSSGAVTLKAAQTGITSLLATDIKIGEDDETKIDFETGNQINFYANNVNVVQLSNANSGDAVLTVSTADKNFTIKGTDGSSAITALDIDMALAGKATFNGDVVIGGGLTVSGTTTTVNSTTVNLNDHNIVLDSNNDTSAVINGAGITIEGGSGDDATFTYNTSGPKFELKLGSSHEDLQVDQLIASSLDISGNVDVDGTLEADAITVDGVTLGTFIRDTVGTNMLSSNTETGITVTYDTSDDNIDFVIDAAQTGITSLLATDIKIGEDDQTKIDFETADEIHFYAANVHQVKLVDNAFTPQADSDVDLGASGTYWKDAYIDTITTTGDVDVGGNIELGHASDTTIARSSAGVVTIEGVEVTTNTASQTLTNKTLTSPVINGFSGTGNGALTGDLTLTSTDADAADEPSLVLYRNSSSPADWDELGSINFRGRNDNSQDVEYAQINGVIEDMTDGTENGRISFETMLSGTLTQTMYMDSWGNLHFMADSASLVWHDQNGTTYDAYLDWADLTAQRNVLLPDADGTILVQDSNDDVIITSTDAGAADDPSLILYRNSSSPADYDDLGEIIFRGRNDNSQDVDYARIWVEPFDVSDGTEGGRLHFDNILYGSETNIFTTGWGFLYLNHHLYLNATKYIMFEGATANSHETILTVADPTADRTITLPDATGTINELLISSGSVSDVSSIDFNNTVITSAFASYRIVLSNVVPASDDVDLMMRLGTSNSADSTSTIYMRRQDLEGSWDDSGSSTASTVYLYDAHGAELDLCTSAAGLGTGTGENGYFEISLVNPNDTSNYKQIGVNSIIYSYYPVLYGSEVDVGLYKTTSAVNFMTVYLSSGNIASADYRVYGAK